MFFLSVLPFLFLALAKLSTVESANILFFHLVATPSHRAAIFPLAARLADAGHNVTYIFPLHRRVGSHPKVKEFFPSKLIAGVDAFYDTLELNIRLNHTLKKFMLDNVLKVGEFCAAFYDSPETQEMLKDPELKYDLILIDGSFVHCAYGLVHHFQAKHVVLNPILAPYLYETFGIVPESSSVPSFIFHPKASDLRTSLWSRTVNTVEYFIWIVMIAYTTNSAETVVRDRMKVYESSSRTMPSFEEFVQDTSLVFYNSYFVENYAVSLPPMFVSFSGILCSETARSSRKPLPAEIEAFINDTDTSGVVYISFGSAVHIKELPDELKNQFRITFQTFPKFKFLFKWNGPLPEDMPKNVMFDTWFPQVDILAHPKIKAFVTQAGIPSIQEALCYGVPMIAIPIFADQDQNAERLVDIGVGIHLDLDSLSSDTLISAIRDMTETGRYKDTAVQLSAMYRDRPVDPLDNVFHWVEYVLKYNTTLLKPLAMKQPWWQRRLLDVYALLTTLLLGTLFFSLFVGYRIIKFAMRICPISRNVPSVVSYQCKKTD